LRIRFYIDPSTGAPHILNHQVGEEEVADVLEGPGEDRAGGEGSRIALGHGHGSLARLQSQPEFLDGTQNSAFHLHGVGTVFPCGDRSIQQPLHERRYINMVGIYTGLIHHWSAELEDVLVLIDEIRRLRPWCQVVIRDQGRDRHPLV
jgi:hypothetical protein